MHLNAIQRTRTSKMLNQSERFIYSVRWHFCSVRNKSKNGKVFFGQFFGSFWFCLALESLVWRRWFERVWCLVSYRFACSLFLPLCFSGAVMEFENFEYVENSKSCDYIDLVPGMSQNFILSCYGPYDMDEQGGYIITVIINYYTMYYTSSQASVENKKMTPRSFLKASSNSDWTQYNG